MKDDTFLPGTLVTLDLVIHSLSTIKQFGLGLVIGRGTGTERHRVYVWWSGQYPTERVLSCDQHCLTELVTS